MKVSELEGPELDYWIAKAEGENVELCFADDGSSSYVREPKPGGRWFNFSTKWEEGGPIIERERIELQFSMDTWMANVWPADPEEGHELWSGPTPLVAAMRCYVASKFGEEVNERL